MVHPVSSLDRSSHAAAARLDAGSARLDAGSARLDPAGGARGQFRGLTVEVGKTLARAASALKTGWLDLRHGVQSILGMRVSTMKPAVVADAADAAKGVLHAMTKRSVDTLDVAEALSVLMRLGAFPRDEKRAGLFDGAAALFGPALRDMSDLQLKRLHSTMERRPELLEGLAQAGTSAALALDEPTLEDLRGAGAVDDLGFLTMSLRDSLMAEVAVRGLAFTEPGIDAAASDRGIALLGQHTVANRGDLAGAVSAARADLADERATAARQRAEALAAALEDLGMASRPPLPAAAQASVTPGVALAARPDNRAVNAPFSQGRIDWIVREKTACMTPPSDPEKDAQKMLPVDVAGGFEVAWIFRRDLTGGPDIALDGSPVFEGTEADASTRAERFCAALSAKGLGKEDILTVSRMINQNTFAVVGSQYMADPDLAPGIRLADGDEIPVIPSFADLKWSVTVTDGGVEVGVTASADLATAPMATREGKIAIFDAGSRAGIAMTFVLDRDRDGALRLTSMRDSHMDVRAASGGMDLV